MATARSRTGSPRDANVARGTGSPAPEACPPPPGGAAAAGGPAPRARPRGAAAAAWCCAARARAGRWARATPRRWAAAAGGARSPAWRALGWSLRGRHPRAPPATCGCRWLWCWAWAPGGGPRRGPPVWGPAWHPRPAAGPWGWMRGRLRALRPAPCRPARASCTLQQHSSMSSAVGETRRAAVVWRPGAPKLSHTLQAGQRPLGMHCARAQCSLGPTQQGGAHAALPDQCPSCLAA
jgi:hypothetical protein